MTTTTDALVQLQAFQDALQRFEDGSITASTLNDQARASQALLTTLPARYGQVLLQLLDRLESSALFTEESSSFSQSDLHQHLHDWLAKAHTQLNA
ncbi:hypothetical protein ACLS0R_10080 [Comamonas jiangduensis]|uniref:hypothetical protein n=1 Tax=Comamonas jiangduensis TaxID=1194168 RepID=UPI003BF9279B